MKSFSWVALADLSIIVIVFVILYNLINSVDYDSSEESASVTSFDGTAEVQEVVLESGVRCAVILGSYKGGISCDWEGKSNNP